MNSVRPSVAERTYDFRLAALELSFPVFDIAISRSNLPIRVEFDAIWWVHVNALHFAPQPVLFRKARHHLQ